MPNDIRKYQVEIIVDDTAGTRLAEHWRWDMFRHRVGGPAESKWDSDTGVLISEVYRAYDLLHRVDGPAEIRRDRSSGEVIAETWAVDGNNHRPDNKPAYWVKDAVTGIVTQEEY